MARSDNAAGGGAGSALPPPPDRRRSRRTALTLGLAAALLVAATWLAASFWQPADDLLGNLLSSMEELFMERHMRARGALPPHPDVVVVAVDAGSVDALGRWPWPRACMAALIRRLAEAGAAVIALDVQFSEPSPGDDILADVLADAGNVVLGFAGRHRAEEYVDVAAVRAALPAGACPVPVADPGEDPVVRPYLPVSGSGYDVKTAAELEPNLDRFEEPAAAQGFFSHDRERGMQHRYDLVTRWDDPPRQLYYPALALAAAARFSGEPVRVEGEQGAVPVVYLGDRKVAASERLRLWINYAGREGTFPTVPAWQALTRPTAELAERLRGKLVFVGVSEVGVGDVVATPFGDMAGVEVHANVAANLLDPELQIHDAVVPQAVLSLAAVFALALLVAWLVGRIERHWLGAATAFLTVVAWVAVCHLAFRFLGWHLHAVPPALAGVLSLVLVLPYQLVVVESRARRVKRLFEHYLSPDYIDELIEKEDFKLGGEEKDLTVLFCDVRGFTSLSEGLKPNEVVDLLKDLFTPLTHAILDEGGTLDKYMGDAIMAFFGAPKEMEDHAARACAGALAMVRELRDLNDERRPNDKKPVRIGIGLNSGEMTVGNMGSKEVFDYTVIGDAVNLGSRIEGLNKVYGTVLLVSEGTKERTEQKAGTEADPVERFLFRELDRVRVKGKEEPVTLYELVDEQPAPPEAVARAERFAAALEAYRSRDFAAAEERFAALAAEGDPPAEVFVERCRRYRAEPPPAGWDGVETFTSK